MKIIELSLNHHNFYCPVTGHHIQGPEHFDASPALVGAWVTEVGTGPFTLDAPLQAAWEDWIQMHEESDIEDDGNRFNEPYKISKFLAEVEAENLVCFEVTTRGFACDPISSTNWFVIDFSLDVEKEGSE